MKNIKIYILVAIAAIIGASCESDHEIAKLDNENAVPSTMLTPADGSTVTLNVENGLDTIEFTWTESDYGAVLPRDYALEMDIVSAAFENGQRIERVRQPIYATTVASLNLLLFDEGLTGATTVYLRVGTSVRNDSVIDLTGPVSSATINMFEYNTPTISSPANGSSFVLSADDAAMTFETFNYDWVDYGEIFNNRYSLFIDIAGNGFANEVMVGRGNLPSYTPLVSEMNDALLALGINPGTATSIDCRIMAEASGNSGVVYGDPISITITAYGDEPVDPGDVDPLYLVGNATIPGWDANNGLPIEWDEASSTYTIITDFVDGGMKILEVAGQWAPQWGDDGTASGILSYRPDEATQDPAEIPSPGTGSYKLTVDIENLTYVFEAQ